MKSFLFSLLITTLIITNLSAQTYHPFQQSSNQPNWVVTYWLGPGNPPIFSYWEMRGDTILGANTYSKIHAEGSSQYEGALREDAMKKVYFIPKDSSSELLIYDFDITPGDTLYNIWCNFFGNWYQDTLHVLSDDTILRTDGNYYNRYELRNNANPGLPVFWNESFGDESHFLYHITVPSVSGTQTVSCFYNNANLNYSASGMVWSGPATCYMSQDSYSITQVQVFPNPTADLLLVELPEQELPGKYEIIDMQGRITTSGILTQNTIAVNHLPVGLYTLKITGNGGDFISRFIKQ